MKKKVLKQFINNQINTEKKIFRDTRKSQQENVGKKIKFCQYFIVRFWGFVRN